MILHRHTSLVPTIKRAKDEEVLAAEEYMRERRRRISILELAAPSNPPHDHHEWAAPEKDVDMDVYSDAALDV